MIDIVTATRYSESEFWNQSPLGISLRRLEGDSRLTLHGTFENRRGLPEVYNAHIETKRTNDIAVFIHDDVWIDDYYFSDRVIEGLRSYDVIGVAGNRRRINQQPAWAFVDTEFNWDDDANLSGAVAHGETPFGPVSFFGPVPADCELLDGVLLASKKSLLRSKGALFDPRFLFHFYDMDFSRNARQLGLRIGTWPICITHQSSGGFNTMEWNDSYCSYLEKWQD